MKTINLFCAGPCSIASQLCLVVEVLVVLLGCRTVDFGDTMVEDAGTGTAS